MKISPLFFISFILFTLYSCDKKSNEVIVYTSVDQIFSEPILKDFEKDTGIKVKAVYDAEETKSTGVLNRIIAEKENPQCDVFWSGDPVRTIILQNKKITQPYHSKTADDLDKIYIDKEYNWTGFSARARVLLYNQKLLDEKDIPTSIIDLTKEQYKGKFAMANPLFGTTTFHMAALFSVLGDKNARQLLEALKANEIVITSSNGDVKKRVINGEIACGITDTDDAFEALKESKDVGIVFLDQENIGTLIIPNTVNLIKNSPNQENGKKLIDYLLDKKTEAKLAKSCAQMPLHKGVQVPDGIPSLDAIHPMNVDYNKAALKLEEIQGYLKEWLEK